MYLDIGAFVRYNFRAFFKANGQHHRLTLKRVLFLILWIPLYCLIELFNRFFFLLDEIFFPKYHKQEIKNPIFIIGNPRSGTTFLHRLMAKDTDSFTVFKVWELALAPSITQRKIIWAIIAIGRLIGYPISRRAKAINETLGRIKGNTAHTIKIEEAEEDEHVMIHSFTSETLFALYPYTDEVLPYFYFDRDIPKEKQRKVMRFYRNMLQRHIYAHGGDKIFLSKNPSYSSRVAALLETFPDARFIKLVRNPFEAMPSMLDSMSIGLNLFCNPLEQYPFKDEFIELMKYYYFYPVEFFKDKKDICNFIKYDDLVAQPDEIVDDLYTWLGIEYSENFAAVVERETHREHTYKSKHEYPLEKMGLTEGLIFAEFAEVFSYYEFDNREFELPEQDMPWKLKQWSQDWKAQRRQRQINRGQRKGRKLGLGNMKNGTLETNG